MRPTMAARRSSRALRRRFRRELARITLLVIAVGALFVWYFFMGGAEQVNQLLKGLLDSVGRK